MEQKNDYTMDIPIRPDLPGFLEDKACEIKKLGIQPTRIVLGRDLFLALWHQEVMTNPMQFNALQRMGTIPRGSFEFHGMTVTCVSQTGFYEVLPEDEYVWRLGYRIEIINADPYPKGADRDFQNTLREVYLEAMTRTEDTPEEEEEKKEDLYR